MPQISRAANLTQQQSTAKQSRNQPRNAGPIVAIQYGLDARLISLMVGIGAFAAFLTLPVWWRAFEFL